MPRQSTLAAYLDIEGPINAVKEAGYTDQFRVRIGWHASLCMSLQDVKSLHSVLEDVIDRADEEALAEAERIKFTALAEQAGAQ